MKKLNPIFKVSFKFGIIGSLFTILLFLILYYFGQHPLLIPAILDFRIILFPIILVFSIRAFKEQYNNGILHFWQGMSVGLTCIVFISLSMLLFILLFGEMIEKSFLSEYIQQSIQNINEVKENLVESIGEEVLQKSLEILPTTTIFDLALDYFLKSLPYGIFLTIIISLILRRKPNF